MQNMNDFDKNALNDEELEDVTGGKRGFNRNGSNPVTKMKCKFCGYEVEFAGHFEDKTFECKKCHKKHGLEPVR